MVRKTFTDSRGKRRHLTKWQQEVSKHGMRKAKKSYAGYKQVPAKTTTTGHVRNVKGGTRRVKDSKVGRGKRSILSYKGDRVGTWTKSGGPSTKGGGTGLSWYMERGYGTAKKPVPKTPLTERLGIAGKGRKAKAAEGMLVPGAVAGLNQEESWEMQRVGKKTIREAQGYNDRMDESMGMSRRGRRMKQSMKDRRDESKGMEKSMGRRAYQRVQTMDAQGYNDRMDESMGMSRRGRRMKQSMKDRRNESKGMEKSMGRRAYQRVGTMDAEGLPVQNVEDGISEEIFGDVGEGNNFGQMRAETFNAPTKFSDAAKKPGYSAKGNKLYHKGDLVGKRDSKGNLTRKGVNTGRGWYMERGYGTARNPVPHTDLTRKLGIAGAGKQTRTPLGLFGRIKRMLVPSSSGINQQQPWEVNRPRASMIREAEGGCPNCGFHQ